MLQFIQARTKLTLWYTLIIMLVSTSFSSVIFNSGKQEVLRFEQMQRMKVETKLRNEGFVQNGQLYLFQGNLPKNTELIEESLGRIFWGLFAINSVIFVLSVVGSYALAGITLEPIKKMVHEQEQFVSDASHELKTPITSLKTAFEVHLRDNPTDKEKKILEESLNEVQKLQTLTQQLFDASIKDSSIEKLIPVSVKQSVVDAIEGVMPMSSIKNITIQDSVDHEYVLANDSLKRLITIFLDNAIKYSDANATIKVFTTVLPKHIKIHVKDEGIGISDTDKEHIFKRLYRASKARSKDTKNSFGLGLSIAKNIIDSYKGLVKVISKEGEGSEFIVTLKRIHIV